LEQYTILRRDFVQAPPAASVLDDINNQTNALQSAIWTEISAIVREQPTPISASLMASLNEVFDMTSAGRFAFELRLPAQIFWLLIGLALLGMAALGFQLGLRGSRTHGLAALVALTWTLVIVDIIDLAASRIGFLRTSAAPYEWTLQGFHSETATPMRQ
jgi:predicted benzoate:H+ symporter BenE